VVLKVDEIIVPKGTIVSGKQAKKYKGGYRWKTTQINCGRNAQPLPLR